MLWLEDSMKKCAVACAVLVAAAATFPLGAASERIDYEALGRGTGQ